MNSPALPVEEGGLIDFEIFWRDHYEFLKERGYTLRKRYEPDWTPSWLEGNKNRYKCEDSCLPVHPSVLDATRNDGTFVVLKTVDLAHTGEELEVCKLFSSPKLSSNPRNHCVPIIEIIEPREGSNISFIVMPLLHPTEYTEYETIGEVVEFFRQMFEGVEFMHNQSVCHGDCKFDNILGDMQPLYAHPLHPTQPYMRRDFGGQPSMITTRTSKPVKYYLIDFGLSRIYGSGDVRLEQPPWGGDKTVPEHLIPNAPPCDPFAVDVYCIGNFIREAFVDGNQRLNMGPKVGFGFMRELISDMVNEDPTKRPSMGEVVARYNNIMKDLGEWTLRSPVVEVGHPQPGIFGTIFHWTKQLIHVVYGIPAIPKV